MNDTAPLPEAGFVRLSTITQLLGIGTSSWWQAIADGRYPPGIKLGPRTTAWHAHDIRLLIDLLDELNTLGKRAWRAEVDAFGQRVRDRGRTIEVWRDEAGQLIQRLRGSNGGREVASSSRKRSTA